eukprot:364027-Chlamydomonas_euryale.AAC.10
MLKVFGVVVTAQQESDPASEAALTEQMTSGHMCGAVVSAQSVTSSCYIVLISSGKPDNGA